MLWNVLVVVVVGYTGQCKAIIDIQTNQERVVNAREFASCTLLETVNIDNSIEFIGVYAFSGCTNLVTVKFPTSLKTIKDKAFEYCSKIVTVDMSDTKLEVMGPYCFQGTMSLRTLRLPSTLKNYGEYTLLHSSLDARLELVQPCAAYDVIDGKWIINKVHTVVEGCVPGVSNTDLLLLSTTITTFGRSSCGSHNLGPQLAFPDNIQVLEGQCLSHARIMTHCEIGKGIKTISGSCFVTSTHIEYFSVHPENQHFVGIDGAVYTKDGSEIVYFPANKTSASITLPDNIDSFGFNPFNGNKYMKNVYFESGKKVSTKSAIDIDNVAVYSTDYKILKRLVSGLTGTYACMPQCEQIGYAACSSCLITGITYPTTMTSIADRVFYQAKITGVELSHVKCGAECFVGSSMQTADIPGWWVNIPNSLFWACGVKKVTLGEGIKTFGYRCFAGTNLQQGFNFPQSLETIGEGSFYSSGILSIDLPNQSLTSIGPYAFEACTYIQNIYIPASVRIVHDYAFSSCSGAVVAMFESCNTFWTKNAFYAIYEQVQVTCNATRYFTEYFTAPPRARITFTLHISQLCLQ